MSEETKTPSTNRYDDSAKGGYSYEEKLNLVAAEQMDPKEIGMVSADEAKRVILGQDPPKQKLGDFVVFEASVVPLPLRAHWARKELKVQPVGAAACKEWEEKWIADNNGSQLIQGKLRSGSLTAMVQQEFKDIVLGFGVLLRQTADMLERKYEELKKTDPEPVATRDAVFSELAENTRQQEETAAKEAEEKAKNATSPTETPVS